MKKIYYLFLICLFYSIRIHSNNPPVGFIENKGQIHDQNFKPNNDVKFIFNSPGVNIQLKSNGFSYDCYVFEKNERQITNSRSSKRLNNLSEEKLYKFQRIDVEFIDANSNPQIIKENPFASYFNFNVNGLRINDVKSYSKITYIDIYPNIDLEFVVVDNKVKYNFILNPGADITQIKWKYKGANETKIEGRKIKLETNHGELNEEIPESYYEFNNRKIKNAEISFKKFEGGIYGFSTNTNILITKNERLIIDPLLVILWSTFYGGSQVDVIWDSSFDSFGDLYLIGASNSTSSIATSGAYQTIYGGGPFDCILFKFNSSGTLQWSTYFGGNGDDFCYGLALDKANNVFISGLTNSTNFMTTPGCFQASYGGGPYDAFLAKFNSSGVLNWSTYYGGIADDGAVSCKVDTAGNVFIAGYTSSTVGISTPGVHQPNYGGGTNDGFFAKFNTSGVRQWCSYYGGSGDDGIESLTFDNANNLYFNGQTTSFNLISTPGSHQAGYSGGSSDGMIAKFSNSGARKWCTYYGGSGKELTWEISCDSLCNVYVSGNSTSQDSIASLGAHQPTYAGTGLGNHGDAFLLKFDSLGNRQWGTYYGGTDNENGISIAFKGPYVYLSGVTQSSTQISTPNTFQNSISSAYAEIFLAKFDQVGTHQWGTYIGGVGNDIPYNLLINPIGEIYIAGTCDGNFYISPGAYQPNSNGSIEGIIFKMRENAIGTNIEEQLFDDSSIKVYPNPNNGSFTLQAKENAVLNIVNELGQTVKTIELNSSNNHNYTISNLTSGVYFISDSYGKNAGKIVVIK